MYRVFISLVMLCLGPVAWGQTYYVDATNGNDASSGTLPDSQGADGPWQTTNRVNSAALAPGDIVLFKRGQTWNQWLNVPSAGAPGNPINFGAYGEGAKPVIDVKGANASAFVSYRSYITVRDIAFKNSSNTAIAFAVTGGTYGITLIDIDVEFDPGTSFGNNGIAFTKGGGDIYLSGVRVINAKNNGIIFLGSPSNNIGNVVVENSYVLGTAANDCFIVHEDQNLNPAGSNFTFINNYAEGCAEQGYDITSGKNVVLKGNVSRGCGQGSILIGHSAENVIIEAHESYDEPVLQTSAAINIKTHNVQLLNSVITGSGYHLLSLSDGTTFPTENVQIINNTFVWNGGASIFDMSGLSENVKVLNNIFTTAGESFINSSGNRQYIIRFFEPSRPPDYAGYVFNHNIYYSPDGTLQFMKILADGAVVPFDFSGFNLFGQELSGSTSDPMLAGRSTGNYRLTAGSSAVDRGIETGLSVDHDNMPRIGNPDIGAYEFQYADLSIDISDTPGLVLLGDTVTYTLTVTNTGPATATGVTVTGTLPSCDLGTIVSGASASCTHSVTASSVGTLSQSMSVSGVEFDPNGSNNTATATTTVNAPDLLPTALSASKSGAKVIISDTVKNQGNGNAGGFTVAYYLSTNTTYEPGTDLPLASSSGGSGICTRTVTSLAPGLSNSIANKTCYKPTGVVTGTRYYVLVVDDSISAVVESSETNNAQTTSGQMWW